MLNPHWVTNGIYKILNDPRLAERRGDLCVADAKEMLDPAEYPAAMHGFLFDLMKKFELPFSFQDADGRHLIPELLLKDEPELGGEFQPAGCRNSSVSVMWTCRHPQQPVDW